MWIILTHLYISNWIAKLKETVKKTYNQIEKPVVAAFYSRKILTINLHFGIFLLIRQNYFFLMLEENIFRKIWKGKHKSNVKSSLYSNLWTFYWKRPCLVTKIFFRRMFSKVWAFSIRKIFVQRQGNRDDHYYVNLFVLRDFGHTLSD